MEDMIACVVNINPLCCGAKSQLSPDVPRSYFAVFDGTCHRQSQQHSALTRLLRQAMGVGGPHLLHSSTFMLFWGVNCALCNQPPHSHTPWQSWKTSSLHPPSERTTRLGLVQWWLCWWDVSCLCATSATAVLCYGVESMWWESPKITSPFSLGSASALWKRVGVCIAGSYPRCERSQSGCSSRWMTYPVASYLVAWRFLLSSRCCWLVFRTGWMLSRGRPGVRACTCHAWWSGCGT